MSFLTFFHDKIHSVNDFLMGKDFFHIVRECYEMKYANIIFSDFLWTMRSIYLPLMLVLKMDVPEADLYIVWQRVMPVYWAAWPNIFMEVHC